MEAPFENISLKASHLTCVRGGRTIYNDLSFELQPQQILVLRGGNGTGKSTLLRQLAGFLPLGGGNIIFSDNLPLCAQDHIHYVGHLSGVKPYLSVFENLEFFGKLFGIDAGLDHALEFWGLTALQDTPARFLSEGQKRRVALARLLLVPRPIWLLDEPNVGLDQKNLERLEQAMITHQKTGGLIIMASHVAVNAPDCVPLEMGAA